MNQELGNIDGGGRDRLVANALRELDPGRGEPAYWLMLHQRVVASARPELARRRMTVLPTMSEVLFGWSRAVVSTALLAAAAAGMMLLRTDAGPNPEPVRLEEMLAQELDGSTMAILTDAPAPDGDTY